VTNFTPVDLSWYHLTADIPKRVLKKPREDWLRFVGFGVSLKIDNKNVHFRHTMLFYFKKGKNATQTQGKICAVYVEDAVNEGTRRKWFASFRDGNVDLDVEPR
jgi:hypothetical protein